MRVYSGIAAIICVLIYCSCNPPGETPDDAPGGDDKTIMTLSADGHTSTYDLIASKGYGIESPDDAHNPPFEHITQQWDDLLQRYVFAFTLHLTPDNDRGTDSDRQRNEIKTWDRSPATMYATRGEKHTYRWKFRLPAGFQPSTAFSHIHQLKPVGGDEIPLITITARKKSPVDKLQLIYRAPAPESGAASPNTYLAETDLSQFLGVWVEVEETAVYAPASHYSIKITRISDGRVLLEYTSPGLILWRTGCTFVRPKYGLYRQTHNGATPVTGLRDETLLFADFELTEFR